jgi:hypothetical protein
MAPEWYGCSHLPRSRRQGPTSETPADAGRNGQTVPAEADIIPIPAAP